MAISLTRRDRQPEVMDQPGLEQRLHHEALDGLRRANVVSATARVLWRELAASGIFGASKPVRYLDLACGGGDVVLCLERLARQHGEKLEVHGADINPLAVEHARSAARAAGASQAEFFQLDALHDEIPADYDVVACTLFLHHLEAGEQVGLLIRMGAATRQMILVDDLIRSRLGYAIVLVGSYLLTRSPVVHTDGPLSVRAALTIDEARAVAERAGLQGATLRRHWPERFLLAWSKP